MVSHGLFFNDFKTAGPHFKPIISFYVWVGTNKTFLHHLGSLPFTIEV